MGRRGGQGALLAPGDEGNAVPISDRLKSPDGELGGPTAKSPGEKSSPISSMEPQLLASGARVYFKLVCSCLLASE